MDFETELEPVFVSPLRAAQLYEAVMMLAGCIDGTGDLLDDPRVRSCYDSCKALLDEIDKTKPTRLAKPEQWQIDKPKDFPEYDKNYFTAAEMAYRRVVYQGYFYALRDLENQTPYDKMSKHLYRKLLDWRYYGDLRKPVFPPRLTQ